MPALGARADAALGLGLAALLALLAFTTTGGENLAANTWVEIALVVIGLGVAATLAVSGLASSIPVPTRLSALAFVALTGFTALSIAWSVAPDQSWLEAARTAGYAGAFLAAIGLARLHPVRLPAVLGGIGVAAVLVCAWAVLAKALTIGSGEQVQYGRLLGAFGYWNATGLMAALGLPALLWASSRRERGRATRALAAPAIALLASVVVLSYSRSALAAAVIGVAIPLAFGRTRLRAAAMLALGVGGAALICAWALSDRAFTGDKVALASRTTAGHGFGLVVVCVLCLLTALGFVVAFLADRVQLTAVARRRAGTAALVALALVPVGGVIALAASSRGLTGEVSHVWSTLTSSSSRVGDAPDRLVALANSRPRYWRQGLSVGEGHPLAGAGAGSFGVAHLRYATARLTVDNADHAHSYVIEAFADLGAIGLALNAALLLAWALASGRSLGLTRRTLRAGTGRGQYRDRAPVDDALLAERDGLWALLGIVVAFGISSAVDWTWFYPGVAVPALLAAGWLAGRGRPGATSLPARRLRSIGSRPGVVLALTGIVVAAVALAWGIWQPLRSADATGAGIAAMTSGRPALALADARAAAAYDPDSLEPLLELHAIDRALGDRAGALAELERATTVQPDNALPWSWLGGYALHTGQPAVAVRALRRAVALDVTNPETRRQLAAAEREARR